MVNLKVYNIQGQLVKNLVDGFKQAGVYNVAWYCRDEQDKQAANGIYLYQLIAGDNTATKKLVFVKLRAQSGGVA